MNATKNLEAPRALAVDTYLGFEIRQVADGSYVALPQGWSHRSVVLLEGADLPAMRKRIYGFWHRFLD